MEAGPRGARKFGGNRLQVRGQRRLRGETLPIDPHRVERLHCFRIAPGGLVLGAGIGDRYGEHDQKEASAQKDVRHVGLLLEGSNEFDCRRSA